MERTHLYNHYESDFEDDHLSLSQIAAKTSLAAKDSGATKSVVKSPSGALTLVTKPVAATPVTKPIVTVYPATGGASVISTDLLKPSIENSGVYFPPVEQPKQAIPKPIDATSPVLLMPNVPGGMVVEIPSIINKVLDKIAPDKVNPVPQKTGSPGTGLLDAVLNPKPVVNADTGTVQAGGFKLPNMWVIIGMVAALIAMVIYSKRKK